MIEAIRYARENGLPFFGICLGLQIAIIEFARNVCGMTATNSTEFEPECDTPVIALMASQRERDATWAAPCGWAPTRPGSGPAPGRRRPTAPREISERHRHRWEVNNAYRDVLAEHGLRLSGQSPDGGLVEMIELPDHPWFIGCQFHPELKSRPNRPHPLFAAFIGAALKTPPGQRMPARQAVPRPWRPRAADELELRAARLS